MRKYFRKKVFQMKYPKVGVQGSKNLKKIKDFSFPFQLRRAGEQKPTLLLNLLN